MFRIRTSVHPRDSSKFEKEGVKVRYVTLLLLSPTETMKCLYTGLILRYSYDSKTLFRLWIIKSYVTTSTVLINKTLLEPNEFPIVRR